MKTFEVQTPALRKAMESAVDVIDGCSDGSLENDRARNMIAASNSITRAVGQELQVRLAAPRLAAIEAKQVEQSKKLTNQ